MEPKGELWNQTPCTIGFTTAWTSFERSERFKLFSIYAKDDVNRQKKVFSLIQKPELLVQQFRRQIEEAGPNRWRKKREQQRARRQRGIKAQSQLVKHQNSNSKPSLATTVTNRLYHYNPKLEVKHDFFGNRSHFMEHEEGTMFIKELSQSVLKAKKNINQNSSLRQSLEKKPYIFTQSRRLDLSKPLNFFPGPGTYPKPQVIDQSKLSFGQWRSQSIISRKRLNTQ